VHSDQWRYERPYEEQLPIPRPSAGHAQAMAQQHAMDTQVQAVRMGWLPFYPQFDRSSLELVRQAEQAGAKAEPEIRQWVVDQLKAGKLRFAVQDPDAPQNWPGCGSSGGEAPSTPAPRGRSISSSTTWEPIATPLPTRSPAML
jgi:nitrate reductase alpha subunit